MYKASKSFKHNILIKEPHIHSYANLVSLNKYFRDLEETNRLAPYLKLRYEFLSNIDKNEGGLKCEYCGRPHLEVGKKDYDSAENRRKNTKNPRLATIDHFFPVNDFENLYMDTRNWVVSCKKCNGKKSNRNPYGWVKTLKDFTFPQRLKELIEKYSYLDKKYFKY